MRGTQWMSIVPQAGGGGLVVAVIVLALAGCASASGSATTSPGASGGSGGSGGGIPGSGNSSSSQPIDGNWKLLSGMDAVGAFSPGSANVTLTLDGANSGGHGPCNSFGATEKGATTGPISIRVGIHTEMACAEAALNTVESRYFTALDNVTHASLAGGRLTLSDGDSSLVFTPAGK